ncbi:MAG: hypothetical protein NWE89_11240 [Candidatus Bathyarchaeota archaeon]|nr:hypothetical protein [Candidatus Bathyarchaeota archaeon]
MYGIDSVTPTVCKLMNIPEPEGATAEPIKEVTEKAEEIVEKALLYAPDAIGEWLFQAHKDEFIHVIEAAPIQVEVRSMTPSYTPVCYGSMFTGMKPEAHGINKYMKPVLKVETLFDALAKAGKRVALVAVKDCSIDLIFRERDIDYYTEEYDPQVVERVLKLLEDDDYDVIVAYNQEYDDLMHGSTPTAPEAIEAFRRHLGTFKKLAEAFNTRYSDTYRVIAFLPDHGTHVDPETGKGSHGTDGPDDMEVRHFWGLSKGE